MVRLFTFTSKRFCEGKGMIIAFERDKRDWGCDVSWISVFGISEKKILFRNGADCFVYS